MTPRPSPPPHFPHGHASRVPPALAVAGVGFGWGSVGKIAAVADALHARRGDGIRLVGLDSHIGRPVLREHRVGTWLDTPGDDAALVQALASHGVRAALVVLDPDLATRLESVGCPVVYVDSLPFLWTEHDPVPTRVSHYCAQLCPSLPHRSWPVLRTIENLRWVGAVVGPGHDTTGPERDPRKAVVNVGGLHSPFSTAGAGHYLELVLNPLLRALRARGFRDVVLTGNLDPRRLPLRADSTYGLTLDGGRLPRERFLGELRTAGLIATSPGRTTLLEIASMGQRAAVLPPQNLSQVMNAADVAHLVDPRIVLSWPRDVLDPDALERERARGEEAAVRLMYRRISRARATWPAGLPGFETTCGHALDAARTGTGLTPLATATGPDGAETIADILCGLLADTETAPAPERAPT